MAMNRHTVVAIFAAGLLSTWLGSAALGQTPADWPEVVAAPAPAVQQPIAPAPSPVAAPTATYQPWIAPQIVTVPPVVAVAPATDRVYTYRPRRAVRQALRRGYVAVPQVLPYQATIIYPYPYTVWAPSTTTVYGQVVVPPTSVYRPSIDPYDAHPYNADPYYADPYGADPYSADPYSAAPSPAAPPTYAPQPTPAAPPVGQPSGPTLASPSAGLEEVPLPPGDPAPYFGY